MTSPLAIRILRFSCSAGLALSILPAIPLALWYTASNPDQLGAYTTLGPALFAAIWCLTGLPLAVASMAGLISERLTSDMLHRHALREALTDGEWGRPTLSAHRLMQVGSAISASAAAIGLLVGMAMMSTVGEEAVFASGVMMVLAVAVAVVSIATELARHGERVVLAT